MPQSRLKVYLVDDDMIYQFTSKKHIEATGLVESVSVFHNGEEAIDFLKKNADNHDVLPDIIFLDINMPVMNGWQFLEAYKGIADQLNKNVLIYMVSSSLDESDINKSKQYGVVWDYVIKPVPRERFKEILDSVCQS